MSIEKAAAMADTSALQPYKGMDVLRTTIILTNAGDGLSQSMSIDPIELEMGSEHFVLLKVTVAEHKHRPIKDVDALELRQVLRASSAMIAPTAEVEKMMAEQEDRILRAVEAAAGVSRLEFPPGVELGDEDEETQVHVRNHNAGSHADGIREGCPLCQAEVDLEELGE